MSTQFMLIILLILPITAIIVLFFLKNEKIIKNFSIFISFSIFIISLPLWILFDKSTPNFQFLVKIDWISQFNMYFYLGIDGISLFFIILTTFFNTNLYVNKL
jgi:NADH-quinone oxidoreductase subunit M